MQMTKTMATINNSDLKTISSATSTEMTKAARKKQRQKEQQQQQQQQSNQMNTVNADTVSTETATTSLDNSAATAAATTTATTMKKKKSKLQSFKALSDATIKSRYSVRSSTSSISIKSTHHHHHHHHHPSPHWLTSFPSSSMTSTVASTKKKASSSSSSSGVAAASSMDNDEFWSATSSTEERQKIREFWLQLGEDERRSLVKVEKEAVLRKMKDQQRHGCNCSVCGKKRTAIEDELEVLYDAYYEELEQYANHQQHNQFYGSHTLHAAAAAAAAAAVSPQSSSPTNGSNKFPIITRALVDSDRKLRKRISKQHRQIDSSENDDDEDDEDEDDEDEECEDGFDNHDGEAFETSTIVTRHDAGGADPDKSFVDMAQYTSTASHMVKNGHTSTISEHFNFGNSLTVKGGILTVADDLLKNDGRKFLDMMERLAERRIQRDEGISIEGEDEDDEDDEEDEEYYDDDDEDNDDERALGPEDDHDDDEDEDDEEEDDEEEEEERYFFNDTRTEEQRIEEGRRMFQIFAARMFEQRVLSAYREKVARERQQRLIQELEEEDRLQKERELKKQRDKEKKKDKKRLLKKQKEEERLAREAQQKAEEEAQRLERERKEEVERRKREAERQKKEEERQRKEEERQRKEEEKRRRQREEKERRRKEKEEQQRLKQEEQQRLKQEQQRKEELERQQQLERQRKEEEIKEKEKQEALECQRSALESMTIEKDTITSATTTTTVTAPVPASAITTTEAQSDSLTPLSESVNLTSTATVSAPTSTVTESNIPDETRQRVLMNALLGSSGPLASKEGSDHRLSTPTLSFVPSHLDVLQSSRPSSMDTSNLGSILSMSPGSPSLLGQSIGGSVGTGLFAPINNPIDGIAGPVNKTPRASVPSVGAIGQPINNERRSFSSTSLAGSLGHTEELTDAASPSTVKRRSIPVNGASIPSSQPSGVENSFFSNFLFGESNRTTDTQHASPLYQQNQLQSSVPNDLHPVDRRFNDRSSNWTNGWNVSNVLTNGIRSNLFGDSMTALDRHGMILDRAKTAYIKLDEITHSQPTSSPSQSFYTLIQLHRMMSDMYYDQPIDVRELYDILTVMGIQHGFQCVYSHGHQDYVVRYTYDSQLQVQHHFHAPSASKGLPSLTNVPATSSPPLSTQGLPSFLSSSSAMPPPPPPLVNRSSIPYSSMSPPHLSFSSAPPSFTSPPHSLPLQSQQQQSQQTQQTQQPQQPYSTFSGAAPIFGA